MKSHRPSMNANGRLRHAQQGVVLFISLIVLVAMTLAGIAVMRSVDTNNIIAGNLAFRNAATSAGDAGIEIARSWLSTQTAGVLSNDGAGYYANWQEDFDYRVFNWAGSSINVGTDSVGNAIYYVIHRMCKESTKAVDSTDCSKVGAAATGSSKGGGSYGVAALTGGSLVYFRVTTKIVGPRNTVSYIQAFVY